MNQHMGRAARPPTMAIRMKGAMFCWALLPLLVPGCPQLSGPQVDQIGSAEQAAQTDDRGDLTQRKQVVRLRESTDFRATLDSLSEKLGSLHWVSYSPRNYNPATGVTVAQIELDLELLRSDGFDGLIYYTSAGSFAKNPEIARAKGFQGIIAGIWDPPSDAELQAVIEQAEYIDAIVVGNERLHQDDGYDLDELEAALGKALLETEKPVSTSEERGEYFGPSGARLANLCDWLMPNVHPYWDGIKTPAEAAAKVREHYDALVSQYAKPVLIREVGWPTNGGQYTSELAQKQFFELLQQTPVVFAYFEGFDQKWKTHEPEEPYWGLHHPDGSAKLFLNPELYADQVITLVASRQQFASLDTSGTIVSRRTLEDRCDVVSWSRKRNAAAMISKDRITFIDGAGRETGAVDTGGRHVLDAAFSPSGELLYFSDQYVGIFRANVKDGSLESVVTTYGYTLDHNATISPNGNRLFYVHHEHGTQPTFRVHDLDVATVANVHVTTTPHDARVPAVWLNADTLAYVNTDAGAPDAGLNLLNVTRGESTPVDSRVGVLCEDPMGSRLYYYITNISEVVGEVYEVHQDGSVLAYTVDFNAPAVPALQDIHDGVFLFYASAVGTSGIYLWSATSSVATHFVTADEVCDMVPSDLERCQVQHLRLLPKDTR